MVLKREVAHRLFADEFNASTVMLEGESEKDPNHLVSPLGAKVNRLHVVGVCTEVEPVGESGEVYRARISDPTGIFTVYAGQYQAEAAQALSELQPPAYVAVTGKARTYEPEPGQVFVSIRPEQVSVVDEATRDQWVLDTARHTLERITAVETVREHPAPEPEGLRRSLVEGARLAEQHYGPVNGVHYRDLVRRALQGLLPGGSFTVHEVAKPDPVGGAPTQNEWTPPATPEKDEEEEAFDEEVFAIVKRLEGSEGADWDAVASEAESSGASADAVEESLNRLMDKGLVYEPRLGVLKST